MSGVNRLLVSAAAEVSALAARWKLGGGCADDDATPHADQTPAMTTLATAATAAWTREEDKAFENAVAAAAAPPADGTPDDGWFTALVASVPARTAEEVRRHYEALVEDVAAIEAGRIPLPRYAGEESSAATPEGSGAAASAPKDGGGGSGHRREERKSGGGGDAGKSCSKAEQERRKGVPWTEEEHRFVAKILHVFFSPSNKKLASFMLNL